METNRGAPPLAQFFYFSLQTFLRYNARASDTLAMANKKLHQELFHEHAVKPGKSVNGDPIFYSSQDYDEAWQQTW